MNIIEVIDAATETDLVAVRQKIDQLEAELRTYRTAEKLLDSKINGEPERKVRRPKAESTNGCVVPDESVAQEIYDLITREGSMPTSAIAKALKLDGRKIGAVVRHSEWFVRNDEGDVEIAKAKGR